MAENNNSLPPVIKTGGLNIPILPQNSPQAPQPVGLKLPLRPHQLRALNRCLVIESDDSLNQDFGHRYEFTSRGGCLADSVGTGKTATVIGLVLAEDEAGKDKSKNNNNNDIGTDTLVVAPKHLIPQWKTEIEKFSNLDVICGVEEFLRRGSYPPKGNHRHRIVLVDVDSVLAQKKLWYDFRRVYDCCDGKEIKNLDAQTRKTYITAAQFSVKSPKGPCTYIGWLYTGGLHIPQRPWRRVVFDEIQDLVCAGTESQKCLLQLSRTARNVWLLSATPFPHGNQSVKANHELLGFCRMSLDVESDAPLPSYHPFEKIKRKLYIKSPPHVADQAVRVDVKHQTQSVTRLETEKRFYDLERDKLLANRTSNPGAIQTNQWWFHPDFNVLRQMTVHPEANSELRKVFATGKAKHSRKKEYTRGVSSSVQGAAERAIKDARKRLCVIKAMDPRQMELGFGDIRYSIALAEKVASFRATTPLLSNVFQKNRDAGRIMMERQAKLRNLIKDHYLGGRVAFRVIVGGGDQPEQHQSFGQQEFLNTLDDVFWYFERELGEEKKVRVGYRQLSMVTHYIEVSKRTLDGRVKAYGELIKERKELKLRIATLKQDIANNGDDNKIESDDLAKKHGSKPAALVRYLRNVTKNDEQAIVFSYWHDTLKLIQQTLQRCGLSAVFCDGRQTSGALSDFTTGKVPIILLSAQSKASGANLQCATQVILLDPAGSSSQHGAALEEQAIGRAVRMGQERPVTVTRFCVQGTLEEELFRQIDHAKKAKRKKASDLSYMIQDSSKARTLVVAKPSKEENVADEGVEVTATLTQEEQWTRDLKLAEAKGDVVIIVEDSDSDDDEVGPTSAVAPALATPSSGSIRVKTEESQNSTSIVPALATSSSGSVRVKTEQRQNSTSIVPALATSSSDSVRVKTEQSQNSTSIVPALATPSCGSLRVKTEQTLVKTEQIQNSSSIDQAAMTPSSGPVRVKTESGNKRKHTVTPSPNKQQKTEQDSAL